MLLTDSRQFSGKIALAGTLLLMLLIVFINMASPAFNLIVLTAQLIPLALTLPGQATEKPKTYQWLCFADMFYLTQGIVLAFTPGRLIIGLLETGVCLVVFVSAIIFIRTSIKTLDQDKATASSKQGTT